MLLLVEGEGGMRFVAIRLAQGLTDSMARAALIAPFAALRPIPRRAAGSRPGPTMC